MLFYIQVSGTETSTLLCIGNKQTNITINAATSVGAGETYTQTAIVAANKGKNNSSFAKNI